MKKEDILVLVIVLLAAGLSIYRKYKKKGNVAGSDSKSQTAFPSSSKYDDYEPYSKK
jgi:ABC-type cobalt transport system substrate-binding protein